jgi:hypothetical protein
MEMPLDSESRTRDVKHCGGAGGSDDEGILKHVNLVDLLEGREKVCDRDDYNATAAIGMPSSTNKELLPDLSPFFGFFLTSCT